MDELKKFLDKNKTHYDIGIINNGHYYKLLTPFENELVIRFKWKKNSINKLIEKLKGKDICLTITDYGKYNSLYRIEGTNYKVLIIHAVDSHVQLPDCLLRQFRTDNHLYYIDISKNKIIQGSARNYNTEFGYYSLFFENYLSDNYEKIISEIINKVYPFVKQEVREITFVDLNKKINKLFLMAIFRNPKNIKQINEESIFSQLFDGGYDTEYLLMTEEEEDENLISDYVPVLLVNKTHKGLFVTKSLISRICIKPNNNFMIIPLHPKFAFVLVLKKYYHDMVKEVGENSYIEIEEETGIEKLNFQIYLNAKKNNDDLIGLKTDLDIFLLSLNSKSD